MASLDDLKKRITSVKSTQKITKAMKMVAAAKLRRAQENAEKGRPYSEKMNNIILNLSLGVSDVENAPKLLAGTGQDKTHLCIVLTSDRGLCGGFNTNIIKKAKAYFNKITTGTIDFSSGENNNIINLYENRYNIGVLICYEIIFPGKVINGKRPDFLVNLTNDGWYGNTYGPLQHLASARARAIEEGLPVIRSANTGVSAIINEYGQYLKRLELGEEGVLDINLALNQKKTFYSVYGNFLYLISLIFMLMLTKFTFISRNFKQRK